MQTDFERGATITNFSPITLLEFKYFVHNYLCQERGGYRQEYGRNEVDSLLNRRGRTLAARSEVLVDKEDIWFVGLDDEVDSSEVITWMRRVYPRVDYTQAPWTVVFWQPSQNIIFQGRHRCFVGDSAFVSSFCGTPLL